jgi:hypothetical protein
MPLMSFAWRQMHANFLRRYKWAFGRGYDLSSVPVVAAPDFDSFTDVCGRMLQVRFWRFFFPSDADPCLGQDFFSVRLFQSCAYHPHAGDRDAICGWLCRPMDE